MSSDVPISEQIEGCEDGAKYLSDLNVYPSIPDRLRAAAETLRKVQAGELARAYDPDSIMQVDTPPISFTEDGPPQEFMYALNAMENAAQSDNPAKHDYKAKRKRVLAFVATQSRRIAEVEAKHAANHDAWVDTHASALKRIAELQRALEEAKQELGLVRASNYAALKMADWYRIHYAPVSLREEYQRGFNAGINEAAVWMEKHDASVLGKFSADIAALATAQPSEGSDG